MADYQAKIQLIVEGQDKLRRLEKEINSLTKQLESIRKNAGGFFNEKDLAVNTRELAAQLNVAKRIEKVQQVQVNQAQQQLKNNVRLTAAQRLYNRYLKESETVGKFEKSREKELNNLKQIFEANKDNLGIVQATAVAVKRLNEEQRAITTRATKSEAFSRRIRDYGKQLEALQLIGVTEGQLAEARRRQNTLAEQAGRQQFALATKTENQLKRQIKLLQERNKLIKGVGATSPISGLTRAGTVIPGSPAAARVAAETTRQTKALEESESQAARNRLAQAARERAASLQEQAEATASAAKAAAEATSRVKALEESESQAARTRLAQAAKEKANSLKAQAEAAEAALTAIRKLEAERSFAARGFRDPARFDTGGVVRRTIATTSGAFFGPGGAPPTARGAAVEAEAAVRRQVEREFELRQEYEKRLAFIEADFDKKANFRELNFIQKELEAEIDKIEAITAAQKKADDAALNDFDRRLKARTDAQTETARVRKQRNERLANVTLGAGFPLLFGGGPGAVIGGGLGGALGTGPQALAAQIGLSALGQVLDQFGASAVELSAALNPLTLDVEKIIPALGATNTETAEYLRKLVELERQDEALAVATEELAKIVGFDGVRALRDYGDAVVSLSNEWSKLITQLQAGLAGLLEGPVRFLAGSLERFNLLRQARTSTDPRIQLLFAQAQNTIRVPGKLKSLGVPDDRERIEEQIVKLQRENNQEAEKRAQLEQKKSGSFEQQLRLLTAQTELAALGNDLTKQAVFEQQKLIIQKERELAIQEAQGDAEKIAIADARARLSLQQLRSDRLEAQLDAEKRLTDEYERQRKKLEELDKKRKDQLNTAKENYVLLLQDIDIQTATTDQAKAQAEYDKQRIERGYRYSKLYADALSSSERIVLASAQELEILLSKVELEKELERIALKKAELINKPTGLEAIQDETELLLNRINGREKEYLIEKKIQELIKQGIAPDIAENEVRTNANLKTQAELVEKQKKLWADIYTTITGNITSAVEGLIAGTQTWGELLSNILGSLGTLFLNQGFSALGTSLGLTGFAEGGFVTGPTRALIGEGGESEYVIPASKMKSAMNRYAAGARGNAVLSGGDETSGGGTATMAPAAIDVRYNVERINNVDYVTNQEFQAGLQQAASQGAERGQQLALRRLQQSVTTRRRLGI